MTRWTAIPLLACLACLATVVRASAGDDARIRGYEEKLEQMQRELDDLRTRLRALEGERPVPVAAPAAERAPSPAPASEQDRKIGVLAEEVERLKSTIVLPESKAYKSFYGLGPAASKVYQVERGLSIGGYGEFHYRNLVSNQRGTKDSFDLERFVLYTGYKFTDRIIVNSEIEFEHATTEATATSDDGAVSVEFAALDFLLWQPLNVRVGLLLVPMGFLNEVHEPPFFYGVARPEVEHDIIPTTWSEGGVGFFGTLADGLDYRAYVTTGLNANGFEAAGIRGGRQKGKQAFADDFGGTVRLDYAPFAWSTLGASMWAGGAGQNQRFDGERADVFTLIWEAHAQIRYRGLEMRALGAFVDIDDAAALSRERGETIGENQFGFYAEAAYDVMGLVFPASGHSLAPFFRYEILDTQDGVPRGFARAPGHDVQLYTIGVTYRPHPQLVLKVDYRNFDTAHAVPRPDEVNLGAGFIF